jgi:hypothetical protein
MTKGKKSNREYVGNRFLKINSLIYFLKNDKNNIAISYFLKRPFFYTFNLFLSFFKESYKKNNDIYFFNIKSLDEFYKKKKNSKIFIGFSYCQKQRKCPERFFSNKCNFNPSNEICKNCQLGCFSQKKNKNVHISIITTINEFANEFIQFKKKHPKEEIYFVICACNLSIDMYCNFANMLKLKGIALKLNGHVCKSFNIFKYAEKGMKNKSTYLLDNQISLIKSIIEND